MKDEIMFASIDEVYNVYYVPGDPEGRWIVTCDYGVVGTNFNMPEEVAELTEMAEAIIRSGEGKPAQGILQSGQITEAEELMIEWGWVDEDLVMEESACPKCGERRMGCLINEEGHVVCDSCGHEYDLDTFAVMNPWTKEIVEVSISEVTQEKLDFLATLMDDEITEKIHSSRFCPVTPGGFFAKYSEIVGAEEAGKIWFA